MSEVGAGSENLPLSGLRCVEFCWVWAGPMMGQHLADLGAEVIKVEWYKRFDLYRTRGVERLRGHMAEGVRRESSYSFQSLNRNKLGFAVDLKRSEGVDLVKGLIAESDILIENFTVGTLDRMGLDSDVLNDLNDQLVVVSLSATGRGSPVESLRSYGLMLSALGGYESLVRDEHDEFLGSPTFVMSDPNAALFGVFAALAGALHARETGLGATYECSQVEAVASLMETPPRSDQDRPVGSIRETADGGFVAISDPANDMPGQPDGAEGWERKATMSEVVERAQAAGRLATPVEDLAQTSASELFAGSETRQSTLHPISGERDLVATPWHINGRRAPVRKPAPLLGESNEYVLRSVLGLDEQAIAALHESGVVDES
ncbi:MAG: CaiB/BaiF CoA transferase family protein [Acidimicrobiales bacterium]